MTQSEPTIPGTLAAASLLTVAAVLMVAAVTLALYGLYAVTSWAIGLA